MIPFLHELQVMYAADVARRLTIEPVTCGDCADLGRVLDSEGCSWSCVHCTEAAGPCQADGCCYES